jgi:methyl-accepting chemotaxis protein
MKMSFLNNLRMVYKVGLIALAMACVMIALIGYMANRMTAIDDAYSDIIKRVDNSTVTVARIARRAETFREAAFELLTEPTDAGNVRLLKTTRDMSAEVIDGLNKTKASLPEKATEMNKLSDTLSTAFSACKPSIEAAAKTTDQAELTKIGERLRTECSTVLQAAIEAQVTFVGDMVEFAKNRADGQHAETTAQIRTVLIVSVMSALASLAFALAIGIFGISRPLGALVALLQRMGRGEDVEMIALARKDEVGDTARGVEAVKQMLAKKAKAEAEAKVKQDLVAAELRKSEMHKLADQFERAVGEIVETVSSASTELEASASTLTNTSGRTQELTTMVAAASEEASTNVQSVASASEELSSSVNEISRQVQESARMASGAVDQARTTTERVSELSKAASRIGDVVELINTIAGQTNLLALNATIEAARAGEAGRGFAVVASEVKALAEQTAKATGEIGQQVSGIQAATQDSVSAIKDISGTIERLSEISSAIAAAVEEQEAKQDLLAGAVGGAVPVIRQQPAEARSRQVSRHRARRLTGPALLIPPRS